MGILRQDFAGGAGEAVSSAKDKRETERCMRTPDRKPGESGRTGSQVRPGENQLPGRSHDSTGHNHIWGRSSE